MTKEHGTVSMTCADCGSKVRPMNGNETWWLATGDDGRGYLTCRRSSIEGVVIAADFHHVNGQQQIKYRKATELANAAGSREQRLANRKKGADA